MKTIIQTPTNNLEESIAYYEKLNFKLLSKKSPTIFSGGSFMIEINPDRFSRAGLKLYKTSWTNEVNLLKEKTNVLKIDDGFLVSDTSGVWIYLLEKEIPLVFQTEDFKTILGKFAGMSLETISIKSSQEIYRILGFNNSAGNPDQGWLTMANKDGFTISFMAPNSCPHLFFNPSLTYFNGKEGNPIVIQNIRDLKIPITEEITHFNKYNLVDNIIIRDPGGLGFFIYND